MKTQARSRLPEAVQWMRAGKPAEAERICRAIVASSPGDGQAWHLLGVLLAQRGAADEGVTSLERAVELVPRNAEAWLNLGVLAMASAPARAEECFRRVLQIAPTNVPARGNLATLYHDAARYDEAERELRALLKQSPKDVAAMELLARVCRMQRNFAESVRLLKVLLRMQPRDARLSELVSQSYFLWYDSVDAQHDKAIAVLEEWLKFEPDAVVARHMHASLTGRAAPSKASAAYVEQHFDAFAEQFDRVLETLGYQGTELLRDLLAEDFPGPRAALDIADVGCGTGKLGALVASWKRHLVGVDLSQKMLDKAAERGVYDALVRADITEYLATQRAHYDVVACADTLVYLGDVTPLFAATFASLRAGGRFLGTIEALDEGALEPFRLHTGGRYAHKRSHIEATLTAAGFSEARFVPTVIRLEFKQPVHGFAFVARAENPA